MKKSLMAIILVIIITFSSVSQCYATEVVSSFMTWEQLKNYLTENFQEFKDNPKDYMLKLTHEIYTQLLVSQGTIPNQNIEKAYQSYWNNKNFGSDTVGDMTVDELDAMIETYYGKLLEQNSGFNSDGNLVLSDKTIKQNRNYFNQYCSDNNIPLYYLIPTEVISEKKSTDFSHAYIYESIQNFVDSGNDFAYQDLSSNQLKIINLKDIDNYFAIGSYGSYSPNCISFFFYDKETEQEKQFRYHTHTITNVLTDLNDETGAYQANTDSIRFIYYPSWEGYNGLHIMTNEKKYIKVFTSMANYQSYINGTGEQNTYYTSNYFITENIQQSPTTLDDMVKLYESYDDLCQKILQYVKDNQNATDTEVIKKLDELIQAVYNSSGSSGGSGGSSDVNVSVDVDMTETNGILNKILTKLNSIAQDISSLLNYAILDDNDMKEWQETLKNIVVSPETNINATVGDLSDSFTDTVSLLKTKFPFSIPWDIAFLIGFLAEEPETPVFDIPLKIESWGIDYTFTIDFSQFAMISKVSRTLLSMLFAISLIMLTEKVVLIKRES